MNHGGRFFPTVLYEIVDDPSTDSIVSWSESGKSFIVWNEYEFCRDVLPRFSLIKDMSSFTIRLHTYGFTKVESSEELEYVSYLFVRGKPELTELQSLLAEVKSLNERLKKKVFAIRNGGMRALREERIRKGLNIRKDS